MALSVVEKILGTANPYSTTHLDDTIRLTKSFTIHHEYEAKTYNDLVVLNYKKVPNKYRKDTWRYYKHLAGEYHEVDIPMKVISRDNRKEITLTRETLDVHIDTKTSLAQYGEFYDEVVKNYPEQELLLKTLLSSNEPKPMEEIINLKNWQIVSYNENLVEPQETDLILRLQKRIDNFAIRNLITNYVLVDNLFMATLFCQLYNFIYLNILGLRLTNLKTTRVHSYHLLNYFASHHHLDSSYQYIDNYQRMFLYRNLKYLNSHAGQDETFMTLVEKFFDRKRVVMTNYEYKQLNEVLDDRSTGYGYKQKLLNKIKFVHNDSVFTPEDLAFKEITIHKNNSKEYEYNFNNIDFKMSNSLNSSVKTKDLEITIMDRSNDVKHKLLDILVDYWGVTLELGYNNTIVNFLEPNTGKDLVLESRDAYKLFILAICLSFGLKVETIPDVDVWRAFKEELPEDEWLFKRLMKPWPLIEKIVSRHNVRAPRYEHMLTRRSFRNFIEKVYKFELGMWIYLSSTGELLSHYDVERGFEDLHQPYRVHNDKEDVKTFLRRIELEDVLTFNKEEALNLARLVLNKSSDDVLEANEINRLTQEAVVNIFSKFKSYTTQFLNNFDVQDTQIAGLVAPYYTISGYDLGFEIPIIFPPEVLCEHIGEGFTWKIEEDHVYKDWHGLGIYWKVPDIENPTIEVGDKTYFNGIDDGVCITLNEDESTPNTVLTKELLFKLFDKEKLEWM